MITLLTLLLIFVVSVVRSELIFKYRYKAIEKIYDTEDWYKLSRKYLRDNQYSVERMFFIKWNCWTYNQFYSELEEELKQEKFYEIHKV